jgi:hypothetical protein
VFLWFENLVAIPMRYPEVPQMYWASWKRHIEFGIMIPGVESASSDLTWLLW